MRWFVFLFLFMPQFSPAQCMLKEISLGDKVNGASLAVEGRVLDSECFWNEHNSLILTRHRLEVYKIFNGSTATDEVELITEGGVIGNIMHRADPSLVLNVGDVGVFFLHATNHTIKSSNQFVPFAGPQGFIKYDPVQARAIAPFREYGSIVNELYPSITKFTGRHWVEKKAFDAEGITSTTKSSANIGSFSPSSLTAGTGDVLTINGSGFGNSQGSNSYIEFRNSHSGGSSFIKPLSSDYVSWSDNQVRVKVPASAGTGTFRVVVNGSVTLSSTPINIFFSHLNAESGGNAYEIALVNKKNGGYEWRMSLGFDSNSQAKEAFKRAFQTWRCGTYVNWSLGSPISTNTTASDGINIIRFDTGNELPSGVLGVCYSYWTGCLVGTTYQWYANEMDIIFDDGTNWNFGPGAPLATQIDFESVALHELGHGHQLGHVINSSEIMHFSIGPGQSKRVLSTYDKNGGNYIVGKSTSNNTCLQGAMQALNNTSCSLTGTPVASVSISITSGTNPSCEGTFVTFTASPVNGGNSPQYQWYLNGNTIGTNSNTFSSATLQQNDKVYCVMFSSLGSVQNSPATSNEINILVSQKPGTPEVVRTGQDSLSSSIDGLAYEWKYNSTTTVGNTKSIKAMLIGNYSVKVTSQSSCDSEYSPQYFYSLLGLEEAIEGEVFKIFPNPAHRHLNIEFHAGLAEAVQVMVLDVTGRQVYSMRVPAASKNLQVPLGEISSGLYIVRLEGSFGSVSQKLFVKKH